jgi:hypothetical protein
VLAFGETQILHAIETPKLGGRHVAIYAGGPRRNENAFGPESSKAESLKPDPPASLS